MPEIRNMQRDELRQLVQWAEAEGWNPGLHDANLFWELDPEGYLAMLDDGQLVGGGAIIRHSEDFGFMGLFIVKPSHRGKKLGEQLWFARRDHLLTRLRPGGTIALDGVDPMVPFYAAGGFRASTRHRRFELPSGVLLGPPKSRWRRSCNTTLPVSLVSENDTWSFGSTRPTRSPWRFPTGASWRVTG